MFKILKKLLIFQFFLPALTINAQFTTKTLSFEAIGLKDGLSSYTIRKVIQDQYGFTWIATKDGLNQYDGKSFKIYSKGLKGSEKIVGNDFWDICEDTSRNLLWAISAYGGLNAFDLKRGDVAASVPVTVSSSTFPNAWLRCLNICKGKIWVGTDNGLCIYDPEKRSFIPFGQIPFQKTEKVQSYGIDLIFVDQYDRVWVFVRNMGMVIYSGVDQKVIETHNLSEFHFEEPSPMDAFNSSVMVDPSTVLLATSNGFRKISYDKNGILSINDEEILPVNFTDRNILSLAKDKSGDIWFDNASNLFTYNFVSRQVQLIQSITAGARTVFFDYVKSIYFDRKNYLWLGTTKDLLFSTNSALKFIPVYQTSDKKVSINNVYYLYPWNDRSVYICTANALYRVGENRISTIDSGKTFWYIVNLDKKNFFVSDDQGCFILNADQKLVHADLIFHELKALKDETINSGEEIGDSMLVFGTEYEHGIYLWNFKKHTVDHITTSSTRLKLKDNNVNLVHKTRGGDIWILADDNIGIFDPRTFTMKNISWMGPAHGHRYSIFLDACEANGYYWIAAYGTGILKVDANYNLRKIISTNEGMPTTGINTLESLNDSLLFATSNNGLYYVNVKTLQNRTFFESDGLSSSYNWNSAMKDGSVYIGGDKGFTIINPAFLEKNLNRPDVYINNIKVETRTKTIDTSDLFLLHYSVPSDFLQTTISFSAINYSNPSRTTYAYRIRELDENWINLGTRNFVMLIGLAPGTYTLEVRAANEDGILSPPKTLSLTFLPKWYQTTSFKTAIVLCAVALFYGVYRYRISQLKKQQQIRKEIASDLHDDLGATLNSIKIFTHLAETHPERQEYFQQIKESVKHAYNGLRDMIWVLDDTGDTIDDLLKRIKQFAQPLASANNIEVNYFADGTNNLMLDKTEKRNFLLIIKEAVNNCIKYADCKNIHISFIKTDNKIKLVIKDDGRGFNENEITPGHGLKNIQERARQIHCNASIYSQQDAGTTITVAKK